MNFEELNFLKSEQQFKDLVDGQISGETYNPEKSVYLVPDGDMVVIQTTGTMNTSTLPAMVVPALTKSQVEEIYNEVGRGGYVQIKDSFGQYVVTEVDVSNEEIRFTYLGLYLGYYINGNSVIATYTYIGERPVYRQIVSINNVVYHIYTNKSTALTMSDISTVDGIVKNVIKMAYATGGVYAFGNLSISNDAIIFNSPNLDIEELFMTNSSFTVSSVTAL